MDRRKFLGALSAAPLLGWAAALIARAPQSGGTPQQGQVHIPGGIPMSPLPPPDAIPPPAPISAHAVLVQNQKDIKKDVERLYDLVSKLRNQTEKTDSSEILSLDLLHTTEEIEKLAKQIHDLARS